MHRDRRSTAGDRLEYDFAMTSRRPRAKADKSTKRADAPTTKEATNSAAELYRAAVNEVPAASRARAEAARVAAEHGTPLTFRNHRRPFAMLEPIPRSENRVESVAFVVIREGPVEPAPSISTALGRSLWSSATA